MQGITYEFHRRFRKDHEVSAHQTNPLFKDITDEDNVWLNRDAADEEICQTVQQISPLKAPGLDDMHAIFDHKLRHIIGKNTCLMILKYGHLLKEINETHLTLIPEKEILEMILD